MLQMSFATLLASSMGVLLAFRLLGLGPESVELVHALFDHVLSTLNIVSPEILFMKKRANACYK